MITSKKVCGPRPSSKYPNAYDKDELIKKAVRELNLTEAKARSMTKEQLCDALGLAKAPGAGSAPKTKPAAAGSKTCTRRRIASRYTKKELETLADEKKIAFKGKTYEELCKLLKLPCDNTITLPKTPIEKKYTKDCIERSKKPLKDHQKTVAEFLKKHRGLLAFHKVGSGKTLTAIAVSQCYLDAFPKNKVIVITPAGLLNNFKDEMTTSYSRLHNKSRYVYYSFQGFANASKKGDTDCKNSLLIIDEAHNLRTPPSGKGKKEKGKIAKHIIACAEKAHKVLLLTGTPLYNQVGDIRTLYNMIRPTGVAAVSKTMMDSDVLQRLRCKVSYYDPGRDDDAFPKRVNHIIPLRMTRTYETKYKRVVEDILNDGSSGFAASIFGDKDLQVFFNAIRRAVNNLENTIENAKTTWVVNKIKDTPRAEKIIVFSNFLDAGLKLITQRIPKDVKYAIINGEVPMKTRKEIVKEYNEDKVSVLFLSRAGGEGLDLKGTRHIIIMEPGWNQASIDQVIGRGIRYKSHEHLPKSKRVVHVYALDHLLPEDMTPQTHSDIKKYLATFKRNPAITTKEAGPIPLDPYENSADLYLRILTKRKEIVLDYFGKKLNELSIEKLDCP